MLNPQCLQENTEPLRGWSSMSPGMQVWSMRPGLRPQSQGNRSQWADAPQLPSSNLSYLTCHLRPYILHPHPCFFSPPQANSPIWTLKPIAPNSTFPQMLLSST